MRDGTFTVGDFALFVSHLGFVTESTGFAGRFLTQVKQLGGAARRDGCSRMFLILAIQGSCC